MTLAESGRQLLVRNPRRRVRTPREKRQQIHDEHERSGMTGRRHRLPMADQPRRAAREGHPPAPKFEGPCKPTPTRSTAASRRPGRRSPWPGAWGPLPGARFTTPASRTRSGPRCRSGRCLAMGAPPRRYCTDCRTPARNGSRETAPSGYSGDKDCKSSTPPR